MLEESRGWGFLGPGPIDEQIAHAEGLAAACTPLDGARCLDLGSGGGLPGLVLAGLAPASHWVLLDAQRRRTAFLTDAVARLGWADRVTVVCARAEVAGRGPLRQDLDVVVARGFGEPAVTAECAAPFLRRGGRLIVAEPPGAPDRWPPEGLRELGLQPDATFTTPVAARRFVQAAACPNRFPRRDGLPRKRPLF